MQRSSQDANRRLVHLFAKCAALRSAAAALVFAGLHAHAQEDPATMMDAGELTMERYRIETAEDLEPQGVRYRCDGPDPCPIYSGETDLHFLLPLGWVAEEPYFYTTAAGAESSATTLAAIKHPAGADAFRIDLNLRQRSPMLGPCFQVPLGSLCHTYTDEAQDLADFALIRTSLSQAESMGLPSRVGADSLFPSAIELEEPSQ